MGFAEFTNLSVDDVQAAAAAPAGAFAFRRDELFDTAVRASATTPPPAPRDGEMRDPQQPTAGRGAETGVRHYHLPRLDVAPKAAPTGSPDRAGSSTPHMSAPSAEESARRIIGEARDTARSMLAQARDVIAAERERAVQRGYDDGFARGVAEADDETASLIATCERIGVQVARERERVLAANEADTVELAMSIARRIVNAAIDVDEHLVVEACRGAMRKAFQRGTMQVLAHPDDLALLRGSGPKLARELGGVNHLDFIEERRLERGSVIVRTDAGEIDATIDGKSAKIEQALREALEARRAERDSAAAAERDAA